MTPNPKGVSRLAKRGRADGRSKAAGTGRSAEWIAEQLARTRAGFDRALAGLDQALEAAVADKNDAALIRIANFYRGLESDLLGAEASTSGGADRARVVDAFLRKPDAGGDQGGGGVLVDGDAPSDHEQAG